LEGIFASELSKSGLFSEIAHPKGIGELGETMGRAPF
jgi:hypothetical protein